MVYDVADFSRRARYWAFGTAAPGSGKSPALEPLKTALVEVLRESAGLAPGKASDIICTSSRWVHIAQRSIDCRQQVVIIFGAHPKVVRVKKRYEGQNRRFRVKKAQGVEKKERGSKKVTLCYLVCSSWLLRK